MTSSEPVLPQPPRPRSPWFNTFDWPALNTIQRSTPGRALWLSSARLLAKLLAFTAAVLVARRLGPVYYGQYSLILSFSVIVSYLADFGLVSYLIREVARRPGETPTLLGVSLLAQLAVSVISVTALLMAGFLLEPGATIREGLVIVGLALFLESLTRPFAGVVLGQNRVALSALFLGASSGFNTVLLVMVVLVRPDVLTLVVVAVPVAVVTAAMPVVAVLPTLRPRFDAGLTALPRLALSAFPFALLAGSLVVYDRLDVILLDHLSGDGPVGIYSAADRVVEGVLVIPAAIGASMYPTLSAAPAKAGKQITHAMKWVLPVCCTLAVLLAAPGRFLIVAVYGGQYPGVGEACALLAPTVALAGIAIPLSYLLQAQGRTSRAVLATLIGLVVVIVLNLALDPGLSYRGASVAATGAAGSLVGALFVLSRIHAGTERETNLSGTVQPQDPRG